MRLCFSPHLADVLVDYEAYGADFGNPEPWAQGPTGPAKFFGPCIILDTHMKNPYKSADTHAWMTQNISRVITEELGLGV